MAHEMEEFYPQDFAVDVFIEIEQVHFDTPAYTIYRGACADISHAIYDTFGPLRYVRSRFDVGWFNDGCLHGIYAIGRDKLVALLCL